MEWYIKSGIENTWTDFRYELNCKTQIRSTGEVIRKNMYRYLQVLSTIRLAQMARVYVHNPHVQQKRGKYFLWLQTQEKGLTQLPDFWDLMDVSMEEN